MRDVVLFKFRRREYNYLVFQYHSPFHTWVWTRVWTFNLLHWKYAWHLLTDIPSNPSSSYSPYSFSDLFIGSIIRFLRCISTLLSCRVTARIVAKLFCWPLNPDNLVWPGYVINCIMITWAWCTFACLWWQFPDRACLAQMRWGTDISV